MGTNDSMQRKMRWTFNIPAIHLNHLRKNSEKVYITTPKRSTRHGKTDIEYPKKPTSHLHE
jgi:hypothetical protein